MFSYIIAFISRFCLPFISSPSSLHSSHFKFISSFRSYFSLPPINMFFLLVLMRHCILVAIFTFSHWGTTTLHVCIGLGLLCLRCHNILVVLDVWFMFVGLSLLLLLLLSSSFSLSPALMILCCAKYFYIFEI